jgi:CBS domain-containing protein
LQRIVVLVRDVRVHPSLPGEPAGAAIAHLVCGGHMTNPSTLRRCTVYAGRGDPYAQSLDLEPRDEPAPRRYPTIADRVPLSQIMSRNVICARPELEIAAVVALMIQHHVGCIPVVDDARHPVGMITKFDIVEQLDAFMRSVGNGSPMPADLAARTADEIMMPLAITLEDTSTVANAAAMMSVEDLHHVAVTNARGKLVGVVSTKDITNWLVENDA